MQGITFISDIPQSVGSVVSVLTDNGFTGFIDCDWDITTPNTSGTYIAYRAGGSGGTGAGDYHFYGRGMQTGSAIRTESSGSWAGCNDNVGARFHFDDLHFVNGGYQAIDLSVLNCNSMTAVITNCTGPRYEVFNNSVLNLRGTTAPGDAAGIVASGGQVNP
jgi:hypothetical protein